MKSRPEEYLTPMTALNFCSSWRLLKLISLHLTLICIFIAGCADVVVDTASMGGESSVNQVGQSSSGGLSLGGSISGPDECYIGEELDLCMVCGPSLTPIKPLNDERCPYLPCETLTRYQAMPVEDNGRTCVQYLAAPPVNNCKEFGVCYEDPEEACMLSATPMTLFTVYPGCGEFTGCDGAMSPDASIKPEGSVCHSIGICGADGRCSAPQACEGDKPEYVRDHCSDANTDEGCDLLVDMNGIQNADDISCTLVCATQNGCVTGWDSNNGCGRGGEIGCNTRRRELICRCRGV